MWYLLTLIIAVMLNFLLPRMMPGDPVKQIAMQATQGVTDPNAVQRVIENYAREFGLEKSMPEQFFIYVGKLFQGDMGVSFSRYPKTVSEVIGSSVGWTLALQIPAIIIGWILGNILGAIAAYVGNWVDKIILPIFMFFSNTPAFGLAIVFLTVFSVNLGWFPVGGGLSLIHI